MSDLLFKTKGERDPAGLTDIFFCATRTDRERYLDEISDQILRIHETCTIWYEDRDADQGGLDDGQLELMKLIVVPVTEMFLKEHCRERTKILDRAIAMHIPILPILKEPGLSHVFARMCGKLQVLDGTGKDDTSLPFLQKLEGFLKRILTGSTSVEAVRDAFDGYVFISYRKKDRRHIDELNELVRGEDRLRDIAVWYDEYLVPGEAYNDAIRGALLRSKVILLMVTPNLVIEENYVQRIEYPEAVKNGKVVVPIEAEPTDRDLLQQLYPGLGQIFTPDQKEAIAGILINTFYPNGYVQDNSPVHLYYMGLAYLRGIDLKRKDDYSPVTHIWTPGRRLLAQTGERLLGMSGEAGCDAACGMLVSYYSEEEEISRYYDKAIKWQDILIDRMLGKLQNGEYPEEELSQRALEYADLLETRRKLYISCYGYFEEILDQQNALIETLEYRLELPYDPRAEYPHYDEWEPEKQKWADEQALMGKKLMVALAKEEMLRIYSHLDGHEHDQEMKDLYMEVLEIYLDAVNLYGYFSNTYFLCRFVSDCAPFFRKAEWQNDQPFTGALELAHKVYEDLIDWDSKEDKDLADQNDFMLYTELTKLEWVAFWADYQFFESDTEREETYQALMKSVSGDPYRITPQKLLDGERDYMEDLSLILADAHRETDRKRLRQRFFQAFGSLFLKMDETDLAEELFRQAYRELDGYKITYTGNLDPDEIEMQVTNLSNLINLALATDDRKLLDAASYTLEVHIYYNASDYLECYKDNADYVSSCRFGWGLYDEQGRQDKIATVLWGTEDYFKARDSYLNREL